MRRYFKHILDPLRGDVTVCLAIILLLFPVSASVLCVAPGGHIAIEDINAPCCASAGIGDRSEKPPHDGLAAAGDCLNCTDFFITPNSRGALLESYANVAPNSLADACLGNHTPANISSLLCRSVMIIKMDAPNTITASTPMRC